MKIMKFILLLLLAFGCKNAIVDNTQDYLAFVNYKLDICVINVENREFIPVLTSNREFASYSPFWIDHTKLGFLLFYHHRTPQTKYPLGIYDFAQGKRDFLYAEKKILKYATSYDDSTILFIPILRMVVLYALNLNTRKVSQLANISGHELERALQRPRISPDRNHIVFASIDSPKFDLLLSTSTRIRNDSLDDIYIYDLTTNELTQLTDTKYCDRDPTFSPNGELIAFSSNRDGNYEIYIMDNKGKNLKRLTQNLAKDSDPEFSPQGDEIAFISNRPCQDSQFQNEKKKPGLEFDESLTMVNAVLDAEVDDYSQIWIMSIDGIELRQISNIKGGVYGPLSWSPAK